MKDTIIVSTVGTSLLTNIADRETKDMLLESANGTEDELPDHIRKAIRAHAEEASAKLAKASEGEAAKISAELAGVIAYVRKRGATPTGITHQLLHTDTLQGTLAAEAVRDWLVAHQALCRSAEAICLQHMTAASTDAFRQGIDSLLAWRGDRLLPAKKAGHRIAFNLVGGFKAMHAYVHTIGMLDADEVFYKFGGQGSDLITIPRLPISVDKGKLRPHAAALARLGYCLQLPTVSVSCMPESLVETTDVDGEKWTALTPWGRLLFSDYREGFLGGDLLSQPGLEYAPAFCKDYEAQKDVKLRAEVQEALARLAGRLACDPSLTGAADGLGLEKLRGPKEEYSIRVSDSRRLAFTRSGANCTLLRYGTHDEVYQ